MNETFREFLERLREERELVDIRQAVDIRHVATLVDQSGQALCFHDVIGYDMPLVSGLYKTQRRTTLAMGLSKFSEIETRLGHAIERPIAPRYVKTAAHKEIIATGDDVDLLKLPVPMSSIYDGGPMIAAGVVMARDPEFGLNSGVYQPAGQGKEPYRDRHRNAEQPAIFCPARAGSRPAVSDFDFDRHPPDRSHGGRVSRGAGNR